MEIAQLLNPETGACEEGFLFPPIAEYDGVVFPEPPARFEAGEPVPFPLQAGVQIRAIPQTAPKVPKTKPAVSARTTAREPERTPKIPKNKQKCPHNRLFRNCRDCGGLKVCEHGKVIYKCASCGGSGICKHKRNIYKCKQCHTPGIRRCKGCGNSIAKAKKTFTCEVCSEKPGVRSHKKRNDIENPDKCPHGRPKHMCHFCGGYGVCTHGRERRNCQVCGAKCRHGLRIYSCRECA